MTDGLQGDVAELLVLMVAQGLTGRDHNALTRMDAERIKVLHVADRDAVVGTVPHHLVLNLLPTLQILLHKHLRRGGEGLVEQGVELLLVVGETGAKPTKGEGRAHHQGEADLLGGGLSLFDVGAGEAAGALDADALELLFEKVTVLRELDGLNGGSEDLQIVFGEDAALVERHTAVERRLSAEAQGDGVGLLLLHHLLNKMGCDGQEVNLIGQALAGLVGGDVGID